MQIICISRGSYGYGKDLAEKLAEKLGYRCISREMITEEATDHGIPVGKLETAVVKRRPLSEEMAVEVDRFKAFVAASLCEKALKEGIVYHGRSGHLVLPGVAHIMRVRAIADKEDRVGLTMNRLRMSRVKAKAYNEQVDEDRQRWVRFLYNADWEDPSLYDITINCHRLTIENSASVLMQMAGLPEFEITPALRQRLQDLLLASRCRLAVGKDDRTHSMDVSIRVEKGDVSATYLPRQADLAEYIPPVLDKVEGIKSLVCTVATTNILFIQERFDPEAESLRHLIEIAEKWNAAVELVHLSDEVGGPRPASEGITPVVAAEEYNGGILEDTGPPTDGEQDGFGVPETIDRLIKVGRAGGSHTVYGGSQDLVNSLNPTENYSLIVLGDLFLSKGESLRKRMSRDLESLLSDRFRIPVIGTEDLKSRYLFGLKQLVGLIGFGAIAAMVYLVIFTFQEDVLDFIHAKGTYGKIAAAAAVFAFVPFVAYTIGNFYHNVLKLIKLE